MKTNNKVNFFVKKDSNFWFFFIPLLIIVLISIILLIATGWYFIDYKISEIFAKALKIEFAKYWSRFYDQVGNTELIAISLIYLTILLETWFLIKIIKKNNNFKKKYWIINSYYIVIIIGWIILNIINIIILANKNTGFGKGIDFVFIDDIKYRLTGAILAFLFQTILLILGLYYIRYHLVKTKQILKEQYWIKAIKAFSFLLSTYIIIIILKGTTNRLYFYNATFGDLLKSRPDLLETYQNSGFKYGYNAGSGFIENVPWELQYPWWKSNLSLKLNNFNIPKFNLPWEYAFPSGHINATYYSGFGILLFLKNKNNTKVDWKVKLLFIIWLIHVLSMNFALIVERFHWISDTAFTFIFSSLMMVVIHFSVNKIFYKKIT